MNDRDAIRNKSRESRAAAVLGLPLSAAAYYTWKIDFLCGPPDSLSAGTVPLLEWHDCLFVGAGYLLLFLILFRLFRWVSWHEMSLPGSGQPSIGWKGTFFLCLCVWFPFLLMFYPTPGMNDTLYICKYPLDACVQFPWAYSLSVGHLAQAGEKLFGTREPVLFVLALIQMILFAGILAWSARKIAQITGSRSAGHAISLYFAFFPMIGNYAGAAVRDTGYGAVLLLWTFFLYDAVQGSRMTVRRLAVFSGLILGLCFFRMNGPAEAAVLVCLTAAVSPPRRAALWAAAVLSLLLAVLPGMAVLRANQMEPLFQEAAAVPLQQTARVLVTGGQMNPDEKNFLYELLPKEKWKSGYSPFTVDFTKWDDDFKRSLLNQEKEKFLYGWADAGIRNPRVYAEAWMCLTYSLWNLDPCDTSVQSRFGWALTDANTDHMSPADNDFFAAGGLPFSPMMKAVVAGLQYEGSHFLGTGICFWLTLFCAAVLYIKRKERYIIVTAPVLINTLTLFLATPGSAVFRYSFAYVITLPVLLLLTAKACREEGMCDAAGKLPHTELPKL